MPELHISPQFTVADIRKIRTYDYEMTKNMSDKEMWDYYKKGADEFLKGFAEYKAKKAKANAT